MAVLLQNGAGESPSADHENDLVILLELIDQRDEIAIAADDGEGVDVIVRERHLQRIERQIDVGAILIAPRRRVALHHLDSVLGQLPGGTLLPSPVGVGDLGDDLSALFQSVQNGGHVKFSLQCGLHANFDVIEIDKHRDL